MIAFIASLAWAQDNGTDWVSHTLEQELARNAAQLTLPEAPPIYHLRYQAMLLQQVSVEASMGDLVYLSTQPAAILGVEVRVGTPDLDNTGFGGWQDGFGRTGLPAHPTPSALATAAWRLTDTAYKEAVEQRARKVAQWTPPADHPGDYTLTGAVEADLGVADASMPADAAQQMAQRMSEPLADPHLLLGEVHIGHEAGALHLIDTEGTLVRRPVLETSIRAVVAARAADGALVTDQRLWTVRDPAALPALPELQQATDQLRESLLAVTKAPVLDDEYVGPVIFEGEAAQALFRYVLVPQLEGTPADVPFDSYFGDLGDDREQARLGRRVLPPDWSAVDDPTADPSHPGSFTHDLEGTPAQPVALIGDGIVRDLLMTRVPRSRLGQTNGHARGTIGARQQARAALLTVRPDRNRTRKALRKRALRVARDYGRDHVVVVRRLQEPGVLRHVDGSWFDGEASMLPPPVAVFRVYGDGREELLRGAHFSSVQRWVLRDILAAGPQTVGSYLAPARGNHAGLDPTEGMPTFLSVPDVLVGEVELVPGGGRADPPTLPPPR